MKVGETQWDLKRAQKCNNISGRRVPHVSKTSSAPTPTNRPCAPWALIYLLLASLCVFRFAPLFAFNFVNCAKPTYPPPKSIPSFISIYLSPSNVYIYYPTMAPNVTKYKDSCRFLVPRAAATHPRFGSLFASLWIYTPQ